MIESIQRAIASMNRKKEDGEKGFSLIELIVVVAIIGILVAIAIPVFGNIQQTARNNALEAITSNAATQAAAALAQNPSATVSFTNLTANTDPAVTLDLTGTTPDTVCVTGTQSGADEQKSGPGCK